MNSKREGITATRKRKKKYNNNSYTYKNMKFDSGFELENYLILEDTQRRGKIFKLSRTSEISAIIIKGFKIKINDEVKKIRDAVYSCDMTFRTLKQISIWDIRIPADKFVFVEIKSKITKTASYGLRKKLFIKSLKNDELFIEVTKDGKKITADVYEAINEI